MLLKKYRTLSQGDLCAPLARTVRTMPLSEVGHAEPAAKQGA
jgi:hypothetical protein